MRYGALCHGACPTVFKPGDTFLKAPDDSTSTGQTEIVLLNEGYTHFYHPHMCSYIGATVDPATGELSGYLMTDDDTFMSVIVEAHGCYLRSGFSEPQLSDLEMDEDENGRLLVIVSAAYEVAVMGLSDLSARFLGAKRPS